MEDMLLESRESRGSSSTAARWAPFLTGAGVLLSLCLAIGALALAVHDHNTDFEARLKVRSNILAFLGTYANSFDVERNAEHYASLFTEDGRVVAFGKTVGPGRAKIREWIQTTINYRNGNNTATRHHFTSTNFLSESSSVVIARHYLMYTERDNTSSTALPVLLFSSYYENTYLVNKDHAILLRELKFVV